MFVLLAAGIEKSPYHGTHMCLHDSINVILFTKENMFQLWLLLNGFLNYQNRFWEIKANKSASIILEKKSTLQCEWINHDFVLSVSQNRMHSLMVSKSLDILSSNSPFSFVVSDLH